MVFKKIPYTKTEREVLHQRQEDWRVAVGTFQAMMPTTPAATLKLWMRSVGVMTYAEYKERFWEDANYATRQDAVHDIEAQVRKFVLSGDQFEAAEYLLRSRRNKINYQLKSLRDNGITNNTWAAELLMKFIATLYDHMYHKIPDVCYVGSDNPQPVLRWDNLDWTGCQIQVGKGKVKHLEFSRWELDALGKVQVQGAEHYDYPDVFTIPQNLLEQIPATDAPVNLRV